MDTPELDQELDRLIDFGPPAATAELAATAESSATAVPHEQRRTLALYEALRAPPEVSEAPDLVPAVLARLAPRTAAAPRSAPDRQVGPAPSVRSWWANLVGALRGPQLALGGLVAVLLVAVLLSDGQAVPGAATPGSALVVGLVAVAAAALGLALWWRRRR